MTIRESIIHYQDKKGNKQPIKNKYYERNSND